MTVQSSELYRKMLSTYPLKILRRMTSLTYLLLKMFSSVFILSIARPFLRLISSFVSNKEPRNLHFFQLLSEILLISHFSVLVVFTNRLFCSSISGITLDLIHFRFIGSNKRYVIGIFWIYFDIMFILVH